MKYELILIVTFIVYVKSDENDNVLELKQDVAHEFQRLYDKYILKSDYYGEGKVDTIDDSHKTIDFIVIGSSPTGSVITNRLSEVPEWNVLLIEAGEEASIITDIPILCTPLPFVAYSWQYTAEEQKGFCKGCEKKRMSNLRGKVLGGSSTLNYMLYGRGSPLDYDRWAAMGNPGWSYKDVLPYFLKSEDARIEKVEPGYHRQGGYLSVSDVHVRSISGLAYVKAAQEAGYPYVDYTGKTQIGVSYVQSTTRNGRRHSAEKAFLRPIRDRNNVVITTNSRVVQILIDPITKVAYGVKYVKDKKTYTIFANKEVILSAGSLNSPQLLMLSGIGPKDHLEELGIPVLKNLPVGEILYDHATFPGVMFQLDKNIVYNFWKGLLSPSTYVEYLKFGKGMLTSTNFVDAFTYIRTSASKDDPSYPDVELNFVGASISSDKGLFFRRYFNIPIESYDIMWKPLEHKNIITVVPSLLHPKSHGYIRLKSKDPFEPAKYYVNFFSDPENHDIKTFIGAVREIQRINSKPALQVYGSTMVRTPFPGCEHHIFDTDDYWECGVRTFTGTTYHQVATCKMGPEDDLESVVDDELRVHGIKNLRVADTSIIPLPLSARSMGPAYMVGEKAADIIKEEWRGHLNVTRVGYSPEISEKWGL